VQNLGWEEEVDYPLYVMLAVPLLAGSLYLMRHPNRNLAGK